MPEVLGCARLETLIMAAPVDVREFLDLITRSGLLDQPAMEAVVRRHGLQRSSPAVEAARGFITDKQLTVFQAKQLLKGKWRGLCIGKYKLLYPLGSGGMGYVYAAEDTENQWQVAIKVLSDRYRNDIAMLTRIQLEAQAGLRLKHPNILRTWSINRVDEDRADMYYVVMELVKGVSLNEMIALFKTISVSRSCDIVRQAALGLQHAHEAGLIHRDVKPDNLLIRSDGSVKILDFGLAMIDEHDEEFTMAMIMGQDRLGTADYVAPEQSINSYKVDHRVDIYGLGCTLYFALSGHPPFAGESNADKIRGHRERRPLPIRELRDDVPETVASVLDRMMAKRPEKRFNTAQEVADLLAPFSRRESVEFDFPKVVKSRARWAKRREYLRQARERDESVTHAQSTSEEPEERRNTLADQPFSAGGTNGRTSDESANGADTDGGEKQQSAEDRLEA
jgi:eukaryotic-like serine/threonine-protein kinase